MRSTPFALQSVHVAVLRTSYSVRLHDVVAATQTVHALHSTDFHTQYSVPAQLAQLALEHSVVHPFAHPAPSLLAGNPFPVPKTQCPLARLQILGIACQMESTSFFTVLALRTVDCQATFFQLPPNNFVFLGCSSDRVPWSSTKLNLHPFCTPLYFTKNSLLRQLQNLLGLPHSTLGSSF